MNLCEILKDHIGEVFYSSAYGNITLIEYVGDNCLQFESDIYVPEIYYDSKGSIFNTNGEITLFPSKDQRDWNKWNEEQKHKVPKTWSDIPITSASYFIRTLPTKAFELTSIEKSALAFLKIYQLIEVGYGGNITNEEWKNDVDEHDIWTFYYDEIANKFFVILAEGYFNYITFHTKEQAKEFLSYSENIQLLKDYFML